MCAPFRAENSLPRSLNQGFSELWLRQLKGSSQERGQVAIEPQAEPQREPVFRGESARKRETGEWQTETCRGVNVSEGVGLFYPQVLQRSHPRQGKSQARDSGGPARREARLPGAPPLPAGRPLTSWSVAIIHLILLSRHVWDQDAQWSWQHILTARPELGGVARSQTGVSAGEGQAPAPSEFSSSESPS